MAELLSVFPEHANGKRPHWGYAKYCDGRVWRLVAGVDVAENQRSATAGLYAAARRLKRSARVHVESRNPMTYVFQAVAR